jgi:hypothetical protein
MARHFLAEYPVQYWKQDGSLVEGACYAGGAWYPGEGYYVYAAPRSYYQRNVAFGTLQLDGVVCPVTSDGGTFQFLTGVLQNLSASGNEYATTYLSRFGTRRVHRRLGYDTLLPDYQWAYLGGDFNNSSVRNGSTPYDVTACVKRSGSWVVVKYKSLDLGAGAVQSLSNWATSSPSVALSSDEPSPPRLSYGPNNSIYICFQSGRYAVYDSASESLLLKDKWIDGFTSASGFIRASFNYARDLGVFVGLVWPDDGTADALGYGLTTALRIYAAQGVPVGLSDPVASPHPSKLSVSRFETTVYGAQDEGLEDIVVDWSIDGASAELLTRQSVTDANGKAFADVLCPYSASGSVTVTAKVKY